MVEPVEAPEQAELDRARDDEAEPTPRRTEPEEPPADASSTLTSTVAAGGTEYPADPFASHHVAPRATQLGVTAGQLRILGAAGALYARGPQLMLHGTIEVTTVKWIGIRFSSDATVVRLANEGPAIWSWQAGPALHLLPHRRVDIGAFFEAGPGWVNAFRDDGAWMARMTVGGTMDVSVTPYWFIHFEGSFSAGVFDRNGAAANYLAPGACVGVGVQI